MDSSLAIVLLFLHVSLCYSQDRMLNSIDSCWRNDPNWALNRMRLADCAVGFGRFARGGKGGKIYTVTRDDDNPINPLPGSLRYGVAQHGPIWIVFARDMYIRLHMPLFVTSHTTIDARGAKVEIAEGSCIRLWNVSNVIIHGLTIHDCWQSSAGNCMISQARVERIYPQDGDGISIVTARDVWIDHNTLSKCADGLIDVTLGSTAITISNNHLSDHNEAMLLGNSDSDEADRNMRVTLAFNHFGPNLMQRMPRVRFGYAHVVNNNYEPWGIYAIGGSEHPTIFSEGNRFVASNDFTKKQVTEHKGCNEGPACDTWMWRSHSDQFLNGAYFKQSGLGHRFPFPMYDKIETFKIHSATLVPVLTKDAGALICSQNIQCR
ncbi:hypothetical protein SUGI_0565900 [Cryptomeria japonica]|nr:hypothetical protein SUGI_0565900 [Cryptomeria japonica]